MRLLNGSELADYIKERQAKQVRALRQSDKIIPKLAIIQTKKDEISDIYVGAKQKYAQDINVETEVHKIAQKDAIKLIEELNKDESVHGIIVQLPLENTDKTDEILKTIEPTKDVDALGSDIYYPPATPTAIMWLLNGYNIQLTGKNVLLIGRGRLVGTPLKKMLEDTGITPIVADIDTKDLKELTLEADIIISATGQPNLVKPDMLNKDVVLVDAGLSTDNGVLHGDVSDEVYNIEDITITPQKGGVGPLTVSALFDNVIRAVSQQR